MKTKPWAIALIIFLTLITTIAQILYKMAAQRLAPDPIALLTNWPLIIGGILYVISAALMIVAFKGGEISVLYPLIALSYVWVSIFSPKFFPQDSMNTIKWVGVLFIIGGVSFIGIGGTRK